MKEVILKELYIAWFSWGVGHHFPNQKGTILSTKYYFSVSSQKLENIFPLFRHPLLCHSPYHFPSPYTGIWDLGMIFKIVRLLRETYLQSKTLLDLKPCTSFQIFSATSFLILISVLPLLGHSSTLTWLKYHTPGFGVWLPKKLPMGLVMQTRSLGQFSKRISDQWVLD